MKQYMLFTTIFSSVIMLLIVQIIFNYFVHTSKVIIFLNTLMLIGVLYLLSNRYLFLPFLGETVIPVNVIVDSKTPENASLEYELTLGTDNDGKKVIYWGSQKSDGITYENPWTAYTYENSGVTTVKNGKAILKYQLPSMYKVDGYALPRHLHYRLCCKRNVMMGEVETIILPNIVESK